VNFRQALVAHTQAAELVQPGDRSLDHPARRAQAAAMLGVAARQQRFDASGDQDFAMRLRIVSPIALCNARFLQRTASLAGNGRNRIDQRQKLRDVVSIGFGQNDTQRNALHVAEDVVLRTRVAGIDRFKTKTGEDRQILLCPRALLILQRQLHLRARLEAVGKIDHDQVFFTESGQPIRNLQYPGIRWRRTLRSLKLRYRRPYTARHSSVSWNLMTGKNPLWVAKQHGHSIATMLRVYAAWAEGAVEADVETVKRSMNLTPDRRPSSVRPIPPCSYGRRSNSSDENPCARGRLALDLLVERCPAMQVPDFKRKYLAEREGFEPSKGF
jgi:hypothetical protein